MLEGPVITSERDLLRKLASEQSPINLLDETTWGDTDYEPLQNIVHTIIANRATQNQRVENHVQLAALVCKANVLEVRATARVMINSFIICRFNVWLVAKKKSKMTNEAKQDKVVG